jgi:hypothetical protein
VTVERQGERTALSRRRLRKAKDHLKSARDLRDAEAFVATIEPLVEVPDP